MKTKEFHCSSIYKGVLFCRWGNIKKRWNARIKINNNRISLGYFNTETEAARAYDNAARRLYGEFALLNFKSL